jgi:trehalose 6-phosphate phosphatase
MTRDGQGPAAVPPRFRPETTDGRAGLAALRADPGHALIALDFDGTLSPVVSDPREARAYPGGVAVLRRLARRVGTLAIITGRGAAAVVKYGGLDAVPGLIVLGHYGWERWVGGEISAPPAPPGVAAARRRLPGLLEQAAAPDGTWVEDKGHAIAVHTRRTADPQATLRRLRPPLEALAAEEDLLAQPGRFVLELRPRGTDKGAALEDLVAERSALAVLVAGDDLGDIPAFAAVPGLRRRGVAGLTVCSGSAEVTELAELSDLVLDGPAGVVAFLDWLAGRIEAGDQPASG